MSGTYERTFTVSVPAARAWRAFTDPKDLEVWFAERFESGGEDDISSAESVGGTMHFEPIDVQPPELLRYRQWAESPESGIEVTVVFEADEHGTRITFTQAGFGGPTRFQSDEVHNGMNETLDDLILYLEHGVHFARHRDLRAHGSLGAHFHSVPGALRVESVSAHGFAADVGMRVGDLLLQLGRVAVFDPSDVACFLRDHVTGEEVDVIFARDAELIRARGRLSEIEPALWALPA
jgi:uncharacterized protein YndB with AHSA1/START domain